MKRRNKNVKGKIVGASLLAMIVVLISVFVSVAAAAPWEGYLVPQDSTENYGEDTAVELGVTYDATGLTYGAVAYQVDVHFDPSCVNITDADFSTSPFDAHMFTPYAPGVVRILENSIATMVPISSGTYKMATLTLHGCSTSCTCDIWFDTNVVSDTDGEPITNTYTNGTYTCAAPKPDLNITEKFETLLEDGTFTVTYTVKNIGDGDAGASNTTITIDGVDVLEDPVPALASGEWHTNTVGPFECPCDTTVNVTVCADNENVVDESDEANNCMVNFVECPPCPKPDLNITEKSEEWVSLVDKTYNITYTVCNLGEGDAGASNTTITIDGVDVLEDPVPALAPGECYTNTVGPFTMSGNNDIIKVCADNDNAVIESNEGNNCLENEFAYPGMPDLVITEKSEEWVSLADNTYNVTYTVKNIGGAKANASITCIYIDGINGKNDNVGELLAGASYTNTVGPFTMSGDNDTINVCADCEGNVTEIDENNNCTENIFKYLKPDLVITGKLEEWVNFDEKTYNVTYTLKSIGEGPACASNTSIKIDGVEKATDSVPELAAGASYTSTVGPFTMSGNKDTISVCADKDNIVDESNEANNCMENEWIYNTETATGSGTAYFDSDTGTMEGLTAIPEATLPEEGKPDLVFPHGFFSFNITGFTGQVVNVTITLPGSVAGMEYWKYGPTPDNHTEHWYQFMYDGQTGAEINGNVVILHFIDGQRGDDDLAENGIIVDLGGLGSPPKEAVAVPTLTPIGIAALIGLLSVIAAMSINIKKRRG